MVALDREKEVLKLSGQWGGHVKSLLLVASGIGACVRSKFDLFT